MSGHWLRSIFVVLLAHIHHTGAILYSGVDEFEAHTKNDGLVVVSFATNVAEWGVPIVTIDCELNAAFCASFDVASYPTIRTFRQSDYARYRGTFKSPAITTHVLQAILPTVTTVEKHNLPVISSLTIPLLLAVLPEDDIASAEELNLVAELLKHKYIVGMTHDTSLHPDLKPVNTELAAAPPPPPYLVVLNVMDEVIPIYSDKFESGRLYAFAKQYQSPQIGRLEFSSLPHYMKSGIPLAVIFAEHETERRSLAASLQVVAAKYRSKVNFATADARKLVFLAEPMGLQPGRFPAFSVQTSEEAFPFDQDEEITGKAIDAFISDVLAAHSLRDREL
ncbi:hypothetical protein QBC47DRAFT_406449 [Echria macrotheca]|uniref:protein disulfide-isomerase n=1 Tax=Echria macrotheca TaxID=438768 RepID=A0AAJ0B3U6_9PEZI|nr:hypothetical protein QBC47DRAFT_406449 [Echria macrotheca]